MTVARTAGVFLGTDETTGITIANTVTTTSSEIDMLGGDAAEGWIQLFLKFTSTVTAGSVDVVIYPSRITTKAYADQAPIVASFAPISGTQSIYCGQFRVSRYMTAKVTNNATGANVTALTLGYELFKES